MRDKIIHIFHTVKSVEQAEYTPCILKQYYTFKASYRVRRGSNKFGSDDVCSAQIAQFKKGKGQNFTAGYL